jgi:hypothetical protein
MPEAGFEVLVDGQRAADEDNPRVYFEHEKATQLHRDITWVPAARQGRQDCRAPAALPAAGRGVPHRIHALRVHATGRSRK